MKNLLTLYFILSAFLSFAQNKQIDSLLHLLKNYDAQKLELRTNLLPDESDTTKVNILNNLSKQFCTVADYTTAKKYAEEAMDIAQQIGYKKGISRSYNTIGVIYEIQGSYSEALKNHLTGFKIAEETGDKRGIASCYNNIGNVYHNLGNHAEALKNHFASLKLGEEIGDKSVISASYNNIGIIYEEQGNYSEALKNYLGALKLQEEIGDKISIAIFYNNIGIVYGNQGNYSEGLKNLFASLKISEEFGDKEGIATTYCNIGDIYADESNYPEALKNYFAALKISEEMDSKSLNAYCCLKIGSTKLEFQTAGDGKDWLLKGLKYAKEIGAVDYISSAYKSLAAADSLFGNFKGAYENHKLYILYRDSLSNEENTKKQTQTEMQYKFDKKEAETKVLTNAELNKQKLVRNGFVGGFAVVLLFAGVFLRQRNKTKNEKQRSDKLLLNILPGEVADEIKNTGTAKAKAFTMVTVMFTDFKDFTTVSEKISAELLVDEIHHCFSAFDNILQKHKIEKIKTIGDAYLCASGLPVSNHTHAADMLHAAFEIRDFMLQRKKEKESKGEIPFELRIGIHTGPVVAGVVGVKKYAYDIWGDTVNIAARMEQNSEAGKVNISGNTYELVKEKFTCTHRGKIQAKNKGEIDMYFVET